MKNRRSFRRVAIIKVKGAAYATPEFFLVATATTATTAVVTAEQIAQSSVFPHSVDQSYKNGSTATGKYAFKSVTAATCS